MKTALRFLLLLWGITFSNTNSPDLPNQKSEKKEIALLEKTTQTCGVDKAAKHYTLA